MNGKWTQSNFEKFDQANPHIWKEIERIALEVAHKHKKKKFAIKNIFGYMRYNSAIKGDNTEGEFKLDDGWYPHYARKFLRLHPELPDFFEIRQRMQSYHDDNPAAKDAMGRDR